MTNASQRSTAAAISAALSFPQAVSKTTPAPNPENDLIQHEFNSLLAEAIQQLSKQDRTVILHRFGIAGRPALTLAALGKIMNLSRERVRQIESQAIKRLRRMFMLNPERLVTAASKRPFPMQLSVKRKRQCR